MNRTVGLLVSVLVCTLALAEIRSDTDSPEPKGTRRQTFDRFIYADATEKELPFALYAPKAKKGEKYPLIVYLHDNGKRAGNNGDQVDGTIMNLVEPAAQKASPCFIVAPLSKAGWVDGGPLQVARRDLPQQPADSIRLTFEMIDELAKKYAIDPARVYVMGNGMGGAGAFAAAAYQPDRFAAVCAAEPQMSRNAAAKLKAVPVAVVTDPKANTEGRPQEIVKEHKDAGNVEVVLIESNQPTTASEAIQWIFKQRRAKPAKP